MLCRKATRLCITVLILVNLSILSKVFYENLKTKEHSHAFKNKYSREMYVVNNDEHGIGKNESRRRGTQREYETNGKLIIKKLGETNAKQKHEKLRAEQSCRRHEVVVFIKTHKTGSSTITNILNRFADMNDLKVALPTNPRYRFRWPMPFHWSAVDLSRLDGDTASILCNHARYSRLAMQLIMRKRAKYVTILRNPAEQYESMFNYMDFKNILQLNDSKDPLVEFLRDPVPLLLKVRDKFRGFPESMNLVKNPMIFDLGMYPPAYYNITVVKKEIQKLDRDFELVLIMEYFDESLILLKKALCWSINDILYVKFNQRQDRPNARLNQTVRNKILNWNKADMMLYDFFNRTLWRKISEYGPSFEKDLAEFRRLNAKMKSTCVESKQFVEKAPKSEGSILSFHLNTNVSKYERYFCMKILRNELDYIAYFRQKYKPRGSYQSLLQKEGKKKRSTGELIERLQLAANVRFADDVPRAVT